MFVIIVGGGRIGGIVAERASKDGNRVTVIDEEPRVLSRLRQRADVDTVEGDASDPEVLERAELSEADALVAATRSDPVNLMVVGFARRAGVRQLVSVVNDEDSRPMFERQGVDTVGNPSHLAAEHLYHAFELPGVRDFMPIGRNAEVFTTQVGEGSRHVGRLVRELTLPEDALLVAVQRAGDLIVPRGDTRIRERDLVTLVAPNRHVRRLLREFRGGGGLLSRITGSGWGRHSRRQEL